MTIHIVQSPKSFNDGLRGLADLVLGSHEADANLVSFKKISEIPTKNSVEPTKITNIHVVSMNN